MGMDLEMYAIDDSKADMFREDPYAEFDRESAAGLDFAKSHETLMEALGDIDRENGTEGLRQMVFGGERILEAEMAVLYLAPETVAGMARDLSKVGEGQFEDAWKRYSPDDVEFAKKLFGRIKRFFSDTAESKKGIIKFIG